MRTDNGVICSAGSGSHWQLLAHAGGRTLLFGPRAEHEGLSWSRFGRNERCGPGHGENKTLNQAFVHTVGKPPGQREGCFLRGPTHGCFLSPLSQHLVSHRQSVFIWEPDGRRLQWWGLILHPQQPLYVPRSPRASRPKFIILRA